MSGHFVKASLPSVCRLSRISTRSVASSSATEASTTSAASTAVNTPAATSTASSFSSPIASAMTDRFGRAHTYLRISLTERCNLRCLYCMPADGVSSLTPTPELLRADEVSRLTRVFCGLGVQKVRLTGGEPLVRSDLDAVVRGVHAAGNSSVGDNGSGGGCELRQSRRSRLRVLGLTTNGVLLGRRRLHALRDAGVNALNISLDTLVPAKFELVTRRRGHGRVVQAVREAAAMAAAEVGDGEGEPLRVKVNVVVMRGFNEDELVPFCGLTEGLAVDVRFIEYMPFDGNGWHDGKFVSYAEMLHTIGLHYGALQRADDEANDTSKHYRVPGFAGRVGFITSMTDNFCGSCNRLRITADGNLKACLFGNEEFSLRDVMREGGTDGDLIDVIAKAVGAKHFALGGNKDMYDISRSDNRSMIRIGG